MFHLFFFFFFGRTQSSDNATKFPTRVDNKGKLSSSLLTQSSDYATESTQKDEQNVPQLKAKEEIEGNSVNCSSINCTSEVLEKISSDVVTSDNNSSELLEAIEDVSVGEDPASFLSELHGPNGNGVADGNDVEDRADVADGADMADKEILVGNQNPFYDPSGWTPMEIEAATGNSECMTMEHHLKLRSTYTEVEVDLHFVLFSLHVAVIYRMYLNIFFMAFWLHVCRIIQELETQTVNLK